MRWTVVLNTFFESATQQVYVLFWVERGGGPVTVWVVGSETELSMQKRQLSEESKPRSHARTRRPTQTPTASWILHTLSIIHTIRAAIGTASSGTSLRLGLIKLKTFKMVMPEVVAVFIKGQASWRFSLVYRLFIFKVITLRLFLLNFVLILGPPPMLLRPKSLYHFN